MISVLSSIGKRSQQGLGQFFRAFEQNRYSAYNQESVSINILKKISSKFSYGLEDFYDYIEGEGRHEDENSAITVLSRIGQKQEGTFDHFTNRFEEIEVQDLLRVNEDEPPASNIEAYNQQNSIEQKFELIERNQIQEQDRNIECPMKRGLKYDEPEDSDLMQRIEQKHEEHQCHPQRQGNINEYKQELNRLKLEEEEEMQNMVVYPYTEKYQRKKADPKKQKSVDYEQQQGKQVYRQNIFRINKESTRRHSLKKETEAQSQMIANIEFLKLMRGLNEVKYVKKEWKQQSPLKKSLLLESSKAEKKKKMNEIGFSPVSSLKLSKHQNFEELAAQRSHPSISNLPQIKKSRQKGQMFKPVGFSLYSLQKKQQVFHNQPFP